MVSKLNFPIARNVHFTNGEMATEMKRKNVGKKKVGQKVNKWHSNVLTVDLRVHQQKPFNGIRGVMKYTANVGIHSRSTSQTKAELIATVETCKSDQNNTIF